MSHIALFQFPWQQMSVQPSRNIHHLGWVTAPWDVRTLIYWTRSTVEKEVYSEISLKISFRNRREKWFTKSPGTKGGDPSPPNIFKKDISQSSALPLHHFASSAWMKCTNNPIQLQQDDQDFVCCTQRHFTVHGVDKVRLKMWKVHQKLRHFSDCSNLPSHFSLPAKFCFVQKTVAQLLDTWIKIWILRSDKRIERIWLFE